MAVEEVVDQADDDDDDGLDWEACDCDGWTKPSWECASSWCRDAWEGNW